MKNKATHLKEIAYELKLSVNTVSRALRDCSDVAKKTKERVRRKAYELGYMPNTISQFIKKDDKKLVALIVNNFQNLFFIAVCHLFSKAIKKDNHDFTVIFNKGNEMEVETIKQCISERVDAIITFHPPVKDVVDLAKFHNLPMVFLGAYQGECEISNIYVDNYFGGLLAANYLVNNHKVNKLIYVGLSYVEDSHLRFKSFKENILKKNPRAQILYIDAEDEENLNILKYVYEGYLDVFCHNDEIAYKLLRKLNSVVPDFRKVFADFNLIGWDGLSNKIDGMIDISSVDFDYREMVDKALLIINNKLEGKVKEEESYVISPFLHQKIYI